MNILKGLAGLIPSIGQAITKIVPDKDLAARLTNTIEVLVMQLQSAVVNAKQAIIVAEATGQSWIQRNWRPITMLTFVFIIANNYIIVPYAVAFMTPLEDGSSPLPMLDIPPGMWGLLTVGIGGYIGGRSAEKIAKIRSET